MSVGFGTPIRKLADGVPFEDLRSSPFESLPRIFHDRTVFDVEGGTHTPEAKLSVFGKGETRFRIKIADDVIWDNRLIHAAAELKTFLASDALGPERLFDILEIDPGNRLTLLEIARHSESLLARYPKTEARWELVRQTAQEQLSRLRRASRRLEDYAEAVAEAASAFEPADEKAFQKDLSGSNARCRLWDEWSNALQTLLDRLDAPETLGSRLATILERTDTPEGREELETLLSPYLPRVRGYANKAIERTLKRKGLYDSAHLKMAETGFAKLFPGSAPEKTHDNWTAIAITALGLLQKDLPTLSDRALEKKLVPAMSAELINHLAALEGYELAERSEAMPEEERLIAGSAGLYAIRPEKDDFA
ncbi:MAG: hypothetical protein ACFE0O_04440 [Opitutales bacterium]